MMGHRRFPNAGASRNGSRMRARAVAVAGVSVALLTACHSASADSTAAPGTSSAALGGSTTPNAAHLVARAADALEQAGSVRMQGSITDDDGPGSVDVRLQGADLAGTMVRGGQPVQVVMTGGQAYVNTTAAWWMAHGAPPSAANGVAGVWVHMLDTRFTEPFSLDALLGYLHEAAHEDFDPPVHADGPGGRPVWQLREVRTDDGFLAVAAEGTPYPVELTVTASEGGQSSVDYTFSEFGVAQPIVAPTGAVESGG
jgi:hypothetical protein